MKSVNNLQNVTSQLNMFLGDFILKLNITNNTFMSLYNMIVRWW